MIYKAIHYINQFYAGIGGESSADSGFIVLKDKKGPAIGLEGLWHGKMIVTKVICCGDNYINLDRNFEEVCRQLKKIVEEEKPDVLIAGPAFNAGRYGMACAKICDYARSNLNLPSVTAMWHENPAVKIYVRNNYIISSTETAAGMHKTLQDLADLALKLAKKEKIGPARIEGYLPTGHRYNEYHKKTGAERVVDMLLDKLNGRPYQTEVPLRGFERVPPAPPIHKMNKTTIALFTTGGLVPIGNPDKLKQAFAEDFKVYDISNRDTLPQGVYESIHGGYDTTAASAEPNRLIPLDALRQCEAEGIIGGIYPYFGTTCGVGTNVAVSESMGKAWARKIKEEGVGAVILTST